MTDKARWLLERALNGLNWYDEDLKEEIRAYLAEPEVKPLSNTDIYPFCGVVKMPEGWNTFANQETNTNPSETINSQEVDRSGAKQDEPVDISDTLKPTIGAKLPNGAVASNIYEAYEAGLKEGKLQDEEPVAWTCQDELNALGTDVTCYMYAEPLVGETNIPLYLHPAPRSEFVRLSDEEIAECLANTSFNYEFARAIEDALEEKNK